MHKLTRQSYVNAEVVHPCGAVLEYPQTGGSEEEAIAHIFEIDPSKPTKLYDPRGNIQYSLGGIHGTRHNVECFRLKGQDGLPPFCKQVKLSCKFSYLFTFISHS